MSFCVVLVTTKSQQEAETIAQTVVEFKLAAGANIFPIQSIYRWQGKIHNATEFQLIIQSDLRLFNALEAKIRSLHSYEVPEIIALPILAGSQPYLNWISQNTIENR
ncbi:MAG: divalent-cation tolerance protein CutA [Calothrix sp. C42_A2020_038]|nr:divalent-cation tolerance protein CutA [Calothrix sp. C42_A2020_038]